MKSSDGFSLCPTPGNFGIHRIRATRNEPPGCAFWSSTKTTPPARRTRRAWSSQRMSLRNPAGGRTLPVAPLPPGPHLAAPQNTRVDPPMVQSMMSIFDVQGLLGNRPAPSTTEAAFWKSLHVLDFAAAVLKNDRRLSRVRIELENAANIQVVCETSSCVATVCRQSACQKTGS